MKLVDRLKAIAKAMNIPESDLTLKTASPFLEAHGTHNSTMIIVGYDSKGVKYLEIDCSSRNMHSIHAKTIYERKADYDKNVLPFPGKKWGW